MSFAWTSFFYGWHLRLALSTNDVELLSEPDDNDIIKAMPQALANLLLKAIVNPIRPLPKVSTPNRRRLVPHSLTRQKDSMQQDNQYLVDILHAAQRIIEKTSELSREDFYDDVKVQDSVVRRLLTISKAARRISEGTVAQLDSLPWDAMKNLKSQLSQEENDIDPAVLWAITQTEIPLLIQQLRVRAVEEESAHYTLLQASQL